MSKPKYVKVQVNVSIGNRKSQVVDPIATDEDTNAFDGELTELLLVFVDAVKALPCSDGNYTREDVIDSICETFELQRNPQV